MADTVANIERLEKLERPLTIEWALQGLRKRDLIWAETWHIGPVGTQTFDPQDLGPVMTDLLSRAVPNSDMDGNPISLPGSN